MERSTKSAGSVAAPAVVSDVFADQADATLVYAITTAVNGTAIVASHDGGQTFGAPLYSTSDVLTGVESAKSKPGDERSEYLSFATLATRSGMVARARAPRCFHSVLGPMPIR